MSESSAVALADATTTPDLAPQRQAGGQLWIECRGEDAETGHDVFARVAQQASRLTADRQRSATDTVTVVG